MIGNIPRLDRNPAPAEPSVSQRAEADPFDRWLDRSMEQRDPASDFPADRSSEDDGSRAERSRSRSGDDQLTDEHADRSSNQPDRLNNPHSESETRGALDREEQREAGKDGQGLRDDAGLSSVEDGDATGVEHPMTIADAETVAGRPGIVKTGTELHGRGNARAGQELLKGLLAKLSDPLATAAEKSLDIGAKSRAGGNVSAAGLAGAGGNEPAVDQKGTPLPISPDVAISSDGKAQKDAVAVGAVLQSSGLIDAESLKALGKQIGDASNRTVVSVLGEVSRTISRESARSEAATTALRPVSVVEQINDQIEVMLSRNQRHLRIVLEPIQLGKIEIEIQSHADRVQILIRGESSSTIEALKQQVGLIREALGQHHVAVDEVKFSTESFDAASDGSGDTRDRWEFSDREGSANGSGLNRKPAKLGTGDGRDGEQPPLSGHQTGPPDGAGIDVTV